MKLRRWAAALLCAGAAVVILYVGANSGSFPGTDEPETLGRTLGVLSLLPPVLTVALAFLLRDVVISLVIGVFSGSALLVAAGGAHGFFGASAAAFTDSCRQILETASDPENCAVLILCLVIGGMMEVIRRSGGFQALARRMTFHINTPRKANLMGQALGLVIFFDDYANSLIVGPVMRSVTDRLKISRERLAYVVDSTAAPVTGIAIISSWVAVEVAVINEGFAAAGMAQSGYATFLSSIPYCFYCIFCLVFMFQGSLLGREFGPMLKSEIRARRGEILRGGSVLHGTNASTPTTVETEIGGSILHEANSETEQETGKGFGRIIVALAPIILLCVVSLVSFYVSGRQAAIEAGTLTPDAPFNLITLAEAFGSADTIFLVMIASILGGITAILLGRAFRLFTIPEAVLAWVEGMSTLMMTVMILVLAWSLSGIVDRLGTLYFVVDIITVGVPWWLVPTLIFTACCVISFAIGSYGCMFIVMPMAIPIAHAMMGTAASPESFLLLCVASVLSGSIFGDHCSPLTDCTILSSIGAGCENMDHVRTQMPYALTVAGASIVFGTLLCTLGLSVWICLILGSGALFAVIRFAGKKPEDFAASDP
jgi:Na+/H+ antiporter NhaC